MRRSGAVAEVLEYDPLGAVMFRKVGTKAYWYVGPFATVTADVSPSCLGYGCSPSTTPKVGVHVLFAGSRIATVRAPPSGSTADPAGDVLYYHRDQRGSVIVTTLTGGRVGVKYRYGPYGQLDREEVVDATGESELGYTGGLRLGWTPGSQSGSLLLLGARVYHAELGRWVQADAVEIARYTYVGGDPVNLIDPTGRVAVYLDGMYIGEDNGAWAEQVSRFYSSNLGFPRRYFTTDPRIKYFSTVVAVVSVDPGTGKVTVLRYQFGLETTPSTASSTYTPSESLLQPFGYARQLSLVPASQRDRALLGAMTDATGAPILLADASGLIDSLISHGHGFLNSFDYISVGVGFYDWVGGGLHVTLDRNGYITWGWAGGVGLGGKGFGLSLGTYEGDPGTPVRGTRPSGEQLRTLNTGWSTNLSAAFGPGIGANWPWHSQYTATELQLQVPGFGLSVGKSAEITRVRMLSW